MTLTPWSKIVKPRPVLWAAAAASVLTAVCLSIVWSASDGQTARLDRFGASVAGSLAALASEPLLHQDHIHLGVITNNAVDVPGVSGVGIYSIDDQLLAGSGPLTGTPYAAEIRSGDAILGRVQVRIDPAAFAPPSPTLRYGLTALVILLVPFLIWALADVSRFSRKAIAKQQDLAAEVTGIAPEPRYLLAVNLFNQLNMTPEERELEVVYALELAARVAELYGGEVARLPGTGALVAYDQSEDPDRAFQVLCAAFVLAHLLDEDAGRGSFRLAIHELSDPADHDNLLEAPEVVDVALLSAVARYKAITVSDRFFLSLERRERLIAQEAQSPLLEDLTTASGGYLVTSLSAACENLVRQQAERLAQRDSTTSASTL